jgi:hypothetical protein
MRSSPHQRAAVVVLLIALGALSLSGSVGLAATPTQEYEASPEYSKCCENEIIESGSTEKEYFVVTNTGSQTWGAPGGPSINLGTDKPRGRSSKLAAPSWSIVSPGQQRASVGVSHEVPYLSSYKFVFEVKAPIVSEPTTYEEHFALLAETKVWMDQESGLGPDLLLNFTVVPAKPPTISMSLSSSSVTQGSSFTANVAASDVASVNHVALQFAGQQSTIGPIRNPEIAPDEQPAWSGSTTFNTNGIGSGPQTVTATVYNDAGLSSTASATLTVLAPPPPPPPPPPPKPRVLSPIRMYFAGLTLPHRPNDLRLTRVVILGTTKGERVLVACHSCQGSTRLGPKLAKGGELTFRPRNLVVNGRSKLIVYLLEPGWYGHYKVYAIHVNSVSATPRQQGCLKPDVTIHAPCPP